ncbi:MAG: S41 family peptidase [Planctomycetes bacterium]|nr:S41 family peptidase [Planctomycetota bacterium]
MNRSWVTVLLVVVTAALTASGPATADGELPGGATAAPADSPARSSDLAQVRREALTQLLAGQFRDGVATLMSAAQIDPEDPVVKQAAEWTRGFLERREADEKDRLADYEASVAVARVLLNVALHADEPNGTIEAVREHVDTVREVVIDIVGAPHVGENIASDGWYAERLARERARMVEALGAIRAELDGQSCVHAEEIGLAADRLLGTLDAFIAATAEKPWGTLAASERSLNDLSDQTDTLLMATDDLSALVTTHPWQAAVDRLLMIKQVAGDDLLFLKEPWAEAIVAGAEKRAEELVGQKKWYEALALYGVLREVFDDERYDDRIKHTTRWARVVSLYAPEAMAADADQADVPESEEQKIPEGDEVRWTEFVSGVDADMVRNALARIDETYVETVDYQKLLLGGLRAVRVLAQSPEVADTFDGLADEGRRTAFIARIDRLIAEAERAPDSTHRFVGMALMSVLDANRQTVNLPDEVIDVEFTEGVMQELDRFSSMIWPSEWSDFRKQTMGSFRGVGIQIQLQRETDLLMVVTPLEDSPAYHAGIKAGDLILEIDGESARGIDIEEAVRRITGPEGTTVTLTIKRPGLDTLLTESLVRAEIHIQTVKGWRRTNDGGWDWMLDPDNGIGYVRITNFNRDTVDELRRALAEMHTQGVRGLILDLRGNPGGFLKAAVDVTDEFVRRGQIVSTKGRQQQTGRFHATPSGQFLDGELVVLVDKSSASAAEIVSGALKDLGRAVIVGQRSFGKGSVQNLIPIRPDPTGGLNDAYLKITAAYYYLPSDRCLHRIDGATEWGVEPDINPPVTPRQLRRWMRLLRRTEIIKSRDEAQLNEDMALQFRADIQLDTALLVCRLRLLEHQSTVAESDSAAAMAVP